MVTASPMTSWKTIAATREAGDDPGLAGRPVGPAGGVGGDGGDAGRVVGPVGEVLGQGAGDVGVDLLGVEPGVAELGEQLGRQGVVRRRCHRCSTVGVDGSVEGAGTKLLVEHAVDEAAVDVAGPGDVVALGEVLAPVRAAGLLADQGGAGPGRC